MYRCYLLQLWRIFVKLILFLLAPSPNMMENNLELDTIVLIIENQPNLYLADEMEDYIQCASFQEVSTFPAYFPKEFQDKILSAFNWLKVTEKLQKQPFISLIKQRVQSIRIKENKYWSAASKLLRLDVIKAFPYQARKQMSQMLLSDKKLLFDKYIKSLKQIQYLSQQMVEKEMRQKKYKENSFQDLVMRVRQRPSFNASLAYFLNKCKKKQLLSQAEGLIISVKSEDPKLSSKIQGLIFSAEAKDNVIRLMVQGNFTESTMKVNFDSQQVYIQNIEVEAKSIAKDHNKSKISEALKAYKYSSYNKSNQSLSFKKTINNKEAYVYIEARKRYFVKMLYQGDYRSQYEQLLNNLINAQKIDINSHYAFLQEAKKIVGISNNAGNKEELSQVAVSLLLDANFQEFMAIGSQFNNKKICEMLAISEQKAEFVKGKKIISFFGATGAGKSTCINYLLGFNLIPLVSEDKRLTHYFIGDVESAALKEGEDYAGTSSSAIISETLYSVAYRIRNGAYRQQLMALDVYLCDNPGFRDTRQKEEQLIISDSIDKCISYCQSIEAIVLVIPYVVFHERSCNLFTHLEQLSDLFPNLLDDSQTVFENFYLMITKCPEEVNISSILDEFYNELLNKSNSDIQRATIQKIQLMSSSGRIIVVNYSNDPTQREDILTRLLRNQIENVANLQIPNHRSQILQSTLSIIKEEEYQPAMNNHLLKYLSKLGNLCCYWKTLIFELFIKEIPQNIKALTSKVNQLSSKIEEIQQKARKQEKSSEEASKRLHEFLTQKIPAVYTQIERLQRKEFTEQENKLINQELNQFVYSLDNFDAGMQVLQKQKAEIAKALELTMTLANFLEQQLLADQKQIEKVTAEIQIYEKKIAKLQQGFEYQTILIQQFKRGDAFVPQWHSRIYEETVKSKVIQHKFNSESFQAEYAPEFDPNGLLKRQLPKNPEQTMRIKCKNAILRELKLNKFSDNVVMKVQYLFPQDESQQEQYTFLKIHRKVPCVQYHSQEIDLLKHCKADSQKIKSSKLKQFLEKGIKYKLLAEGSIPKIAEQLKNIQLKIVLFMKANEQFKILQKMSLVNASVEQRLPQFIELKKKELQNLQDLAASCEIQISIANQVRMQLQSEYQFINNMIQEKQKEHKLQTARHKRLAFLIKQQLLKGIPQTLEILASKFMQKDNSQGVDEEERAAVEEKKKQLQSYFEYYQDIKDRLPIIISEVLK